MTLALVARIFVAVTTSCGLGVTYRAERGYDRYTEPNDSHPFQERAPTVAWQYVFVVAVWHHHVSP